MIDEEIRPWFSACEHCFTTRSTCTGEGPSRCGQARRGDPAGGRGREGRPDNHRDPRTHGPAPYSAGERRGDHGAYRPVPRVHGQGSCPKRILIHDRGSRGPPRPAGVSGVRAIRDISGGVTLEMPVKSPRVIAMCSRRSRHSTRDAWRDIIQCSNGLERMRSPDIGG